MKLPYDYIKAAAEAVLPGCHFYHGEREEANIDLDRTTSADRIVYLDDRMPFQFVTTKFGSITGVRYSCLLMLLVPADVNDPPEKRRPRQELMVNAAAQFLARLTPEVQAVKLIRPAELVSLGSFDRPADGVSLFLDVTPRGGLNICLPFDPAAV